MTVEEALKITETIDLAKLEINGNARYIANWGMAVETLREKQIPKKWIRNECFDFDYSWECPCCKEEYLLIEDDVIENGYNYCPSCGQKLYFEEVEE